VDMAQRRVIDVHTGKDSNTITNFVEYLESIRLISENLNLITHLKRHRTIIFTKEKYTNKKYFLRIYS